MWLTRKSYFIIFYYLQNSSVLPFIYLCFSAVSFFLYRIPLNCITYIFLFLVIVLYCCPNKSSNNSFSSAHHISPPSSLEISYKTKLSLSLSLTALDNGRSINTVYLFFSQLIPGFSEHHFIIEYSILWHIYPRQGLWSQQKQPLPDC
jgi:hypothetical protein